MSTTTTEYVATETTKLVGEALKALDKMREDFEKIDTAKFVDLEDEVLTKLHEGFKQMHESFVHYRMLTLIALVMTTKGKDGDES